MCSSESKGPICSNVKGVLWLFFPLYFSMVLVMFVCGLHYFLFLFDFKCVALSFVLFSVFLCISEYAGILFRVCVDPRGLGSPPPPWAVGSLD